MRLVTEELTSYTYSHPTHPIHTHILHNTPVCIPGADSMFSLLALHCHRLSTRVLSTEARLSERENRFYWTVGSKFEHVLRRSFWGGAEKAHCIHSHVYCTTCLLFNKLLWYAINVCSLQLGLGLWAPPPFFLQYGICMYIHTQICIYCMYLRVAYLALDPIVEIAHKNWEAF